MTQNYRHPLRPRSNIHNEPSSGNNFAHYPYRNRNESPASSGNSTLPVIRPTPSEDLLFVVTMNEINDIRTVTLMPSINKLHTRHPRGEAGTKRLCFVISAVMTSIYIIIAEFRTPPLVYGVENENCGFATAI